MASVLKAFLHRVRCIKGLSAPAYIRTLLVENIFLPGNTPVRKKQRNSPDALFPFTLDFIQYILI